MNTRPLQFRLPARRGAANKGITSFQDLDALMQFVNQDDSNKVDLQLTGAQMEFTDRKTLALPMPGGRGTQEFAFNAWSFDQLASMLKIPTKYLESCPIVGKGGMKDQIEARMGERAAKEHIVRLRMTETTEGVKGVIRAVLPGNYAFYDNRHMVPAVKQAIAELGGDFTLQLTNAQDPKSIERQMHMRFVRNTSFNFDEIKIDDPHGIGFHTTTSEVGDGEVRIDALVWRLVCKNGLMGWGDSEVLKLRHRNFQAHEVTPQIHEGVLSAARQEVAVKDMLQRKYDEKVLDPESTLLLLGAKMRTSDFIKDQALAVLRGNRKKSYSRFDIMQAYTQAAQSLSINDRVKLEMSVGHAVFGNVVTTTGETVHDDGED